jgi:hypothetical protein
MCNDERGSFSQREFRTAPWREKQVRPGTSWYVPHQLCLLPSTRILVYSTTSLNPVLRMNRADFEKRQNIRSGSLGMVSIRNSVHQRQAAMPTYPMGLLR